MTTKSLKELVYFLNSGYDLNTRELYRLSVNGHTLEGRLKAELEFAKLSVDLFLEDLRELSTAGIMPIDKGWLEDNQGFSKTDIAFYRKYTQEKGLFFMTTYYDTLIQIIPPPFTKEKRWLVKKFPNWTGEFDEEPITPDKYFDNKFECIDYALEIGVDNVED